MIEIRKEISEGAMLPPWYYGYSYTDYMRSYLRVFHIMPLNIIVRVYRLISYLWDRIRNKDTIVDKVIRREVQKEEDYLWNHTYRRAIEDARLRFEDLKRK